MISFEPLRRLLAERNISTYFLRNKCGIYNLDSKTIQRFMNAMSRILSGFIRTSLWRGKRTLPERRG